MVSLYQFLYIKKYVNSHHTYIDIGHFFPFSFLNKKYYSVFVNYVSFTLLMYYRCLNTLRESFLVCNDFIFIFYKHVFFFLETKAFR